MSPVLALLLAATGPTLVVEPLSPELQLAWDRPVSCLTDPGSGRRLRLQCDRATSTCLVTGELELDAAGGETPQPLQRAQGCSTEISPAEVVGFRLREAVAEVEPGWHRDERGRVMQLNFDLHRRIWLGGGAGLPLPDGRVTGEAEVGIRIDDDSNGGRTLHRWRLLEGRLDPVRGRADALLLGWDYSEVREEPALRITTFLGKPRRFDIDANLGFWTEAGRLEAVAGEPTRLTLFAANPTLDLWRSPELDSYLRLRAGAAVGRQLENNHTELAPGVSVDLEAILDRNGFHRLFATATAERWYSREELPTGPGLRGEAGYELILLSVNDQPVSLVLDGRARRDDAGLEYGAHAGLRVSLWAPARRSAGAP